MKNKITLGQAGEISKDAAVALIDRVTPENVNEDFTAQLVESYELPEKNVKSWGLPESVTINACVNKLRQTMERTLAQPGQFFIVKAEETEVTAFLSALFQSFGPFLVAEGDDTKNHRNNLVTNWEHNQSRDTRRAPGFDEEFAVANSLSRFFDQAHIPLFVSTLAIFITEQGKANLDTVHMGMVNAEMRQDDPIENRFISRAIIAMYHDWLGISNPKRQAELDWKLPPICIHNVEELRAVSNFFFKVLPAMRETMIASLVSREQVEALAGLTPKFLTEGELPNFEKDVIEFVEFFHKRESASGRIRNYYRSLGECDDYSQHAPTEAGFWNSEKAAEVSRMFRDLGFNLHHLTEFVAWIATFKYGYRVRVGGNSYDNNEVEFFDPNGPTGCGFALASGKLDSVTELAPRSATRINYSSYDPLLRTYTNLLSDSKPDPFAVGRGPKKTFKAPRGEFERTDSRFKGFEEWLGRPAMQIGKVWL